MIPADPVSKCETNKKCPVAEIAALDAGEGDKGLHPSKSKLAGGKPGVEFRHCKSKECEKLNDAHRKDRQQRSKRLFTLFCGEFVSEGALMAE